MGDMREYFTAIKEHNKQVREDNTNKYEPILKNIGATEKSMGVWQYKDWFIYPSKGFAMNKFNSKRRKNLQKFLEECE